MKSFPIHEKPRKLQANRALQIDKGIAALSERIPGLPTLPLDEPKGSVALRRPIAVGPRAEPELQILAGRKRQPDAIAGFHAYARSLPYGFREQ